VVARRVRGCDSTLVAITCSAKKHDRDEGGGVGFQYSANAADQQRSAISGVGHDRAVSLRWVGHGRGARVALGRFPVPARRTGYVDLHITGCMSSRLC
jgi:hypothetical protein